MWAAPIAALSAGTALCDETRIAPTRMEKPPDTHTSNAQARASAESVTSALRVRLRIITREEWGVPDFLS